MDIEGAEKEVLMELEKEDKLKYIKIGTPLRTSIATFIISHCYWLAFV